MEIPISLWCGMIPRWKKRTFVLEKEGYKIYEKKENGVIIDKDCRLISLFGGKVINNNNLEFTIETSSAINMIKANTMKEFSSKKIQKKSVNTKRKSKIIKFAS